VDEVLGRIVPWEEAVEAMVRGFSETLCLRLAPGSLSVAELKRAGELRKSKYAAEGWTYGIRRSSTENPPEGCG
jgi:lipoate-protein ligase A